MCFKLKKIFASIITFIFHFSIQNMFCISFLPWRNTTGTQFLDDHYKCLTKVLNIKNEKLIFDKIRDHAHIKTTWQSLIDIRSYTGIFLKNFITVWQVNATYNTLQK